MPFHIIFSFKRYSAWKFWKPINHVINPPLTCKPCLFISHFFSDIAHEFWKNYKSNVIDPPLKDKLYNIYNASKIICQFKVGSFTPFLFFSNFLSLVLRESFSNYVVVSFTLFPSFLVFFQSELCGKREVLLIIYILFLFPTNYPRNSS